MATVNLRDDDRMKLLLTVRAFLFDLQPLCGIVETLFTLSAAKLAAHEFSFWDWPVAYLATPVLYQLLAEGVIVSPPVVILFCSLAFSAAILAVRWRPFRHDAITAITSVVHIQRIAVLTAWFSFISMRRYIRPLC